MTLCALFLCFAASFAPVVRKIETVFIHGDRLSYHGYTITRSYNEKKEKSWAIVRKNGIIVARHGEGEGLGKKEMTRFGLFSLLGVGTKQLIIEQSTGGAHCCLLWWVYDLEPEFRLIFKSDDYPTGDGWGESSIADLDKDGKYEIILGSDWYAYFGRLYFSNSPLPDVVFRYNATTGKYYPANPHYSSYVLRRIKKEIAEIKDYVAQYTDPLAPVLSIMIQYIYAGKQKTAWDIFDKYYTWKDKSAMRRDIRKRVHSDRIFISIYREPGSQLTIKS